MSRTPLRALSAAYFASTLILGGASLGRAQTQEAHEGPLEPQPYWEWLKGWARELGREVDTTRLGSCSTFKESLADVAEQAANRGQELPLLVDMFAFHKEMPGLDVFEVPVDFSHLPARVTVARFLAEALNQLPCSNATLVCRREFVEITTTRAVGLQGIPFLLFRRFVAVMNFWLCAAVACSLLFLALRAPPIWRRESGRLVGFLLLALRLPLVFVLWPIWLLVAFLSLLRKKVTASRQTTSVGAVASGE